MSTNSILCSEGSFKQTNKIKVKSCKNNHRDKFELPRYLRIGIRQIIKQSHTFTNQINVNKQQSITILGNLGAS